MEHFIGISFCIATFFICLQARHIPIADAKIHFMQHHVKCDSESKFYAPTNVKVECMARALECVSKELNGTVKAECNGTMIYVEHAIEFFERKLKQKRPAPTTPAGCECEGWDQTCFIEFLKKVESLLELDNSSAPAHCAASPSAAPRTSAANNELKLISETRRPGGH